MVRKLLFILIAFIALVTFIRAFETPDTEDMPNISRRAAVEVYINN
ncbi:MAG: hypothetical protein LBH97_02145 [Treponema sp.]|jgi:beta-lactam-binding protein with PASTA domain|nr:hypothetical protein [Treponema sp.]